MTKPDTPDPLASTPGLQADSASQVDLEDEVAMTVWQPMLVALLETYLPTGFRLLSEFLLHRLPQRIDIVIIQLIAEVPGPITKLHSILDYLRRHTLIENK